MSKITRNHIFFFIFIGFAVFSFAGYVLTGTWIKKYGFTLIPSEEGSYISPKYNLLEEEPVPADLTVPNIRFSWIIANSLNASGIQVRAQEIHPSLTDSNFYTKSGEINWKRLNKAVPQASFFFRRIFTGSTLVTELKGGRLPLVNVIVKNQQQNKKVSRWLMLIGWKDGNFLVIDPALLPEIKPIPLNAYGKIYGYRSLYRVS